MGPYGGPRWGWLRACFVVKVSGLWFGEWGKGSGVWGCEVGIGAWGEG